MYQRLVWSCTSVVTTKKRKIKDCLVEIEDKRKISWGKKYKGILAGSSSYFAFKWSGFFKDFFSLRKVWAGPGFVQSWQQQVGTAWWHLCPCSGTQSWDTLKGQTPITGQRNPAQAWCSCLRWSFPAHKFPKSLYWIFPSFRAGNRILGNGRAPGTLADQDFSCIFNNSCPLCDVSPGGSHLLRACLSRLPWGNYLEGALTEISFWAVPPCFLMAEWLSYLWELSHIKILLRASPDSFSCIGGFWEMMASSWVSSSLSHSWDVTQQYWSCHEQGQMNDSRWDGPCLW